MVRSCPNHIWVSIVSTISRIWNLFCWVAVTPQRSRASWFRLPRIEIGWCSRRTPRGVSAARDPGSARRHPGELYVNRRDPRIVFVPQSMTKHHGKQMFTTTETYWNIKRFQGISRPSDFLVQSWKTSVNNTTHHGCRRSTIYISSLGHWHTQKPWHLMRLKWGLTLYSHYFPLQLHCSKSLISIVTNVLHRIRNHQIWMVLLPFAYDHSSL